MDIEDIERKLWLDLQFKFENELSEHISKEISKTTLDCSDKELDTSLLVNTIAQNISNTELFKQVYSDFLQEIPKVKTQNISKILQDSPKSSESFKIASTSSLYSSLEKDSLIFLTENKLKEIIHLFSDSSFSTNFQAFDLLLNASSLEYITAQSYWDLLEPHLYVSLNSNMLKLRILSLQLYFKMLSSNLSNDTLVAYQSLIQFISLSLEKVDMVENSDNSGPVIGHLIILKLLNDFQLDIVDVWFRYPQDTIEKFIDVTINFISSNTSKNSHFINWNLYGLVDVQCKWLKYWVHGSISRTYLLELLAKKNIFLSFILEISKTPLDESEITTSEEEEISNPLSCASIKLIHAICFLSRIIAFKQFRNYLNDLYGKDEGWINIVTRIIECTYQFCEKNIKTTVSILLEVLEMLWEKGTKISSAACLEILNGLNKPLKKSSNSNSFTKLVAIKAILNFTQSEMGKKAFIDYQEFKSFFDSYHSILLDKTLESSDFKIMKDIINHFILVYINIVSHPRGLFWASSSQFSQLFLPIIQPDKYFNEKFEKEMQSTFENLVSSFVSSPLGFEIIKDANIIQISIQAIKKQNCNFDKLLNLFCQLDEDPHLFSEETITKISKQIWSNTDIFFFQNEEHFEQVFGKLIGILSHHQVSKVLNHIQTKNSSIWESLIFSTYIEKEQLLIFDEDKYYMALKVLNILVCCMRTLFYLEINYKLTFLLLKAQSEYTTSYGTFIIDNISILRNHILVKCNSIGGPSERFLPPVDIDDNAQTYTFPIITSLPLLELYNPVKLDHQECINIHFVDNGSSDALIQLNELFIQYLEDEKITLDFIAICLERLSLHLETNEISLSSINKNHTVEPSYPNMTQVENQGLKCILNYGICLGIWDSESFPADKVKGLLEIWKDKYHGLCDLNNFNFLLATIIIIVKDYKKVNPIFEKIFNSNISIFLWTNQSSSFIKIQAYIWHWFDILVLENLPAIHGAFKSQSYPCYLIYELLIGQCFWNYLDIESIGCWLVLIMLHGADYSLYFVVALLKHLETDILNYSSNKQLVSVIRTIRIKNFKIEKYLNFMEELSQKYRQALIKDLMNIFCIDFGKI